MGKVLLDPTSGLDKVQAIAIVLFDTRCYSEYIGIENYILSGETDAIHQNIVAALTYLFTAFEIVCLTLLIKRHNHNSRAILLAQGSSFNKLLLTLFEANGVHHRFTLNTFKPSFDHLPFRGIDHNRHARDIWL